MALQFDTTVKLADLVSTLSFVLAILALLYSLRKDRAVRQREQVAQARAILSTALSKLVRWSEVTVAIFRDVQPTIITITELWGEDGNIIKARDYAWKTISSQEAAVESRILEEEIRGAYVSLFMIDSKLSAEFSQTLDQLEEARRATWLELLEEAQAAIMYFDERTKDRSTAQMGNELRRAVHEVQMRFVDSTTDIQTSIRNRLISTLSESEGAILAAIDARSVR